MELYLRPQQRGLRLRAILYTLPTVRFCYEVATEASVFQVFSFGFFGSFFKNQRYSIPLVSCQLWERGVFSNYTFLPIYCPCRKRYLRTRLPLSVWGTQLVSSQSIVSSQLLIALGRYYSLTSSAYSLTLLIFSRGSSVLVWRSCNYLMTIVWECPLQSSFSLASLASNLFFSINLFCSLIFQA